MAVRLKLPGIKQKHAGFIPFSSSEALAIQAVENDKKLQRIVKIDFDEIFKNKNQNYALNS